MSIGIQHIHIAVLTIFSISLLIKANSLPCDDSRCKTSSCDSTGACICDLPDPSTILDGDRPFLGGKYCDEEMRMCDGTNEFWCENGGLCEEIIQGEKYECKCLPGYKGKHCENSGEACGKIFCYNQGECKVAEGVCDCSPEWKGSADCSLPTENPAGSFRNSTATSKFSEEETGDNTNWTVVGLAFSCSAAAVGGGAICAKKLLRKKEKSPTRFQQLPQMPSDDDPMAPNVIRSDHSHL